MRPILIAITFLLLPCVDAKCQVIYQVIGTSGTTAESSGYSLSFTAGEVAVSNDQTEQFQYQEGFWFHTSQEAVPPPLSLSQSELALYPNPTAGSLHLTKRGGIEIIKVFDSSGKLLLEQPVNGDHFSLKELASGIYRVQLLNIQEKTIHTQIIFKN